MQRSDSDEWGDDPFRIRPGEEPRHDPFRKRPEEVPKAEEVDHEHREKSQGLVLVHVYNLGKNLFWRSYNDVVGGYGAFHTGVEVYGYEWAFGMTPDEFSTGVHYNEPRQHGGHHYRETVYMGYTKLTPAEVKQVLEQMRKEWKGCTYELLTRNCHHFSDAFCRRLGVGRMPPWLNELASTGANAIDFFDNADSGYDDGEAIIEFFQSFSQAISYATDCSDSSGINYCCCRPRKAIPDKTDPHFDSPRQHEEDPIANDPFLVSGTSDHPLAVSSTSEHPLAE